MSCLIPLITDVEQARQTILRRRAWEQVQVTPALQASIERLFGEPLTPDQVVARILDDVRERGDAALFDYSRRIEGVSLSALRVSEQEMEDAWMATPARVRDALQVAADRIRSFHQKQRLQSWLDWDGEGGALGQIIRPLARVGLYAPGGRTPYASSLLMAAIPARVAGVGELYIVTPPNREGCAPPVNLVAARIAGVDAVFKIGGAQAIGALAYGTETVPRVDKIGGPGSLFVMLAKRRVYGQVDIDGLPGPTETMLIADAHADPGLVAADLLAQAEHDALASPICLTPSLELAAQVQIEIGRQIESLARAEIAAQSLQRQGGLVLTGSLEQAIELANEYAPEHLCLLVRDPWAWVGRVHNAGGIFVGETASEALGDYVVGPSHIMPTGGTARFASPCNLLDYYKITSIFAPAESTTRRLADAAITIAEMEGLTAHAAAIQKRQDR